MLRPATQHVDQQQQQQDEKTVGSTKCNMRDGSSQWIIREREILDDVTARCGVVSWMELIHYKTWTASVRIISLFRSVGEVSHIISWNIQKQQILWINKMRSFVILSVLVAGAFCARLDNTYVPPANAHSAGGHNLDTPKLAQASNTQNTYAAPGRGSNQYQQQSYQSAGTNQGTFTSVQRGNGFQSVSAGSQSSYQAPQQNYQQQNQQPSYNYQPQQQQQNSYNNQASTTPIPILECKFLMWQNVFSVKFLVHEKFGVNYDIAKNYS